MNDIKTQKKLYVCTNMRVGGSRGSCALRGSKKTLPLLREELRKRSVDINVEEIICLGQCERGPAIRIAPGGSFYLEAGPDKISEIADWLEKELEE
ncbi:putative Ferredoxin, 2Fe-2S [Candidatus Terasakiella magnetica]|uniref:Putative Ferredoxin, 2Fe-2S n=1 Tax=Candidatus Terasakiella magnetica TaxID=1867952 RepID=A0A1C3RD04_9PROT|nr:(2Fe-2S) ferredoxin domain-containing protein [Candidatus Terasakiella magnetica]SCA55160.1 putative Ferredoxin, 2Fe-2S [Candidatus Terasakiella magnetica]